MSTFTPSSRINAESNSRDWAFELGCLPQTASIVFTKTSLIAFLKTHGIEVGPNFTEINKLPKYATIGTMNEESSVQSKLSETTKPEPEKAEVKAVSPPTDAFTAPRAAPPVAPLAAAVPEPTPQVVVKPVASELQAISQETSVRTPDGAAFRPTRRVREPIGGGSAQIGALFGGGSDTFDEAVKEAEREQAKRRGLVVEEAAAKPVQAPLRSIENHPQQKQEVDVPAKESTVFRPTRRVREPGGTGGQSSIALG